MQHVNKYDTTFEFKNFPCRIKKFSVFTHFSFTFNNTVYYKAPFSHVE